MPANTATKEKRRRLGHTRRVDIAWGYFFIAPVMLGVATFSLGPVLYALYMSLTKWDGLTDPAFIGFGNFVELFQSEETWIELRNTLIYAAGVVPGVLVLAIILAVLLNQKIPAQSFFRVAYFLPVVTMPVAIATVWRWLFNSEYGLVNVIFKPFGFGPQWLGDPNWIMTAVIVVAIWSGVGYATIILLAGLQQIPKHYYEAAAIDGASQARQFFQITVPLVSPTIFFLLITQMINAFRAFDIIFMFSGANVVASGGPTTMAVRTVVFGVYQKGFMLLRMGYAASEAVFLFILILIVTLIQFALQKKLVFYD